MNPCPCGWRGDPNGRCRCTPDVATRHLRKLSGPLLDRIDIQIELPALSPAELSGRSASIGETSATVARRVADARDRQLERQGRIGNWTGARWTPSASSTPPGKRCFAKPENVSAGRHGLITAC
ncbi:putative ATPase with chaperone activity [Caballeronia udeis]|uniref:ATPase with chaperone activity n=1 Tax=Caballeronia udeis TaxID=1232866 RepID=A0ABW8M9I3_9BURK